MNTAVITDMMQEGMWVVIQIAAPMLLLSMFVGILLSIFQAVTQIHEQTLTFVPKIIAIVLLLLLLGNLTGGTVCHTFNQSITIHSTCQAAVSTDTVCR